MTKRLLINGVIVICSIVIALILAEIILRVLVPEKEQGSALLSDDPKLIYHILPGGEIDRLGYRNHDLKGNYDIVAVGDSQTFGMQSAPDMTWPAYLQQKTGQSVYNMSLPGFGPVQYSYLSTTPDKALRFKPRLIIWGLYLGNDVYDSYFVPYESIASGQWQFLRKAQAPERLTKGGDDSQTFSDFIPSSTLGPSKTRIFLRDNIRLIKLLGRATWTIREKLGIVRSPEVVRHEADDAWARLHSDIALSYINNDITTVFTPGYRLSVENLKDPRIVTGMQITLKLIEQTRDLFSKQQISFVVAIIPTKERAYYDRLVKEGVTLPSSFTTLVKQEDIIKGLIMNLCKSKNLLCVDTLSFMQNRISQGYSSYPTSSDGHPQSGGYEAIAESIAEYLRSHQLIR